MDFKFSDDFVKDNELSEKQVKAVSTLVNTDYIPTVKKEYDGKANENAEGILKGASEYGASKFGVELTRNQGEKWGDFLQRITDAGFSSKEKEYVDKSKVLQDKLKNFKGDEEIKTALDTEKSKVDTLLAQVAELEPLKGFDEKFKTATEELGVLTLSVAFNSVKPNFPDTVNEFEAKARWQEFEKTTLAKYNIEKVDGEWKGIDKENHHKTIKLSELLEADVNIKELMKGRHQKGTGAKAAELIEIEGVPFKVPNGASSEEQSKLTREYLVKKLGDPLHNDFAKEFTKILTLIKKSA